MVRTWVDGAIRPPVDGPRGAAHAWTTRARARVPVGGRRRRRSLAGRRNDRDASVCTQPVVAAAVECDTSTTGPAVRARSSTAAAVAAAVAAAACVNGGGTWAAVAVEITNNDGSGGGDDLISTKRRQGHSFSRSVQADRGSSVRANWMLRV